MSLLYMVRSLRNSPSDMNERLCSICSLLMYLDWNSAPTHRCTLLGVKRMYRPVDVRL